MSKTVTRWVRDRGVAVKITASVGIAVLVAVFVGVLGLNSLSATADRTTAMYTQNTMGAQLSEEIRFHYMSYRLHATNMNSASTPEAQSAARKLRDAEHEAMLAAVDKLRTETQPSAEVLELVAEVMDDYDQYLVLADQAFDLRAAGKLAEYDALRADQIAPLSNEIVTDFADLSATQQDAARESAAAAKDAYAGTRTTLILAIAIGSVVALLAGIFVARSIASAVNRVRRTAERLAEGDLTQATEVDQGDEIGRMAAAIDAAQSNLRAVLASVVSSADAVAASSEELSASSAQISASAEETSAQSGVV
ncbi:MCP four helix bundle domain-containing protein, partial [Geodermatophilus ruber]